MNLRPDYFEVASDYRTEIIVDWDSPILACKANRERYTSPNQYAGLPYLGNPNSKDTMTWNVFRSIQKADSLDIITNKLGIGEPRGLLLWAMAPELGGYNATPKAPDLGSLNARLQYLTGILLRKFEGILPGQITEPDVVILGATGVAVGVACKEWEPEEAKNLWEGELDRVKHLRICLSKYEEKCPVSQEEDMTNEEKNPGITQENTTDEKKKPSSGKRNPGIIKDGISDEEVAPVYQLVKMALLAKELGTHFNVEPVVVLMANTRAWSERELEEGKSASELWDIFTGMLGENSPRCEIIFWQHLRGLI
ncbi:hypothetical protein ACFLY3_05830 [Chloroflexota bacterium]